MASYGQAGVSKMSINFPKKCAYCASSIEAEQRWVRQKVHDPSFMGQDPTYHHYHVELFIGEELSCWEKHQMESETARITVRRAA
jgi:hypothetical protein